MTVKRWGVRVVFLIFGIVLALSIYEFILSRKGYQKEWHYNDNVPTSWAVDDYWSRYRPKPGSNHAWGVKMRCNRYGFRGPAYTYEHPAVICLGDSCTFGVKLHNSQTYAGILNSPAFPVLNAGIPGYNSFLGLELLEHSPWLKEHPKLVTLYFGWNDHWRAIGTEKMFYYLRRLAARSRIASVIFLKLQESLYSDELIWKKYRWFSQVPLSQFKENLTRMVQLAQKSGAVVVLITAPAEPRFVQSGKAWFAFHSMAEYDDHKIYVKAVREVAARTHAGLVDFARNKILLRAKSPKEYFVDPIHLTAKGQRLLARELKPWVDCAKKGNCPPHS